MAGTGVGKFSSTAGDNTANMTVNFAENMAPSNVNNAARELMGHMRDMYEQLGDGYFEFGDGDGVYTVARGDADTITLTSSADLSGVYSAGRKIRITDGGANVVEGTIASSSHSSTTQTVNLTGITLASGTPTKVELGIDTAAFGGRIILDDDGDTYIEAPTDDTIDIYVAGAKDLSIAANAMNVLSGTTLTIDSGATITNSGTTNGFGTDPDAAQVFNESGSDVNFRIESNTNDNMFNVQGADRVGVGSIADLGVGLHIRTADSGASVHATGDDLVIEGSGNAGLSILSGNTSEGVVYFGDDSDNNVGRIVYDHNNNHLAFTTSGSEQVRLHSNGVLSASDGIALGVGTANTASNVLDDYEEGSYTPAFTVASGSLTVHGSHNTLAYTKIGRVVHVQGEVRFSAVSSPSGNFSISLPFAVADLAEGSARFTSSPIGQSGFGGTPDGTLFAKNTNEGTTTIAIQTSVSGDGNDDQVNANQVSTSTECIFSFTFIAA